MNIDKYIKDMAKNRDIPSSRELADRVIIVLLKPTIR